MLQALSGTICPDTVLLFEPRISYPALRVTLLKIYLKWFDFSAKLLKNLMKITKIRIFHFYHFFFENFADLRPQFYPTNNL